MDIKNHLNLKTLLVDNLFGRVSHSAASVADIKWIINLKHSTFKACFISNFSNNSINRVKFSKIIKSQKVDSQIFYSAYQILNFSPWHLIYVFSCKSITLVKIFHSTKEEFFSHQFSSTKSLENALRPIQMESFSYCFSFKIQKSHTIQIYKKYNHEHEKHVCGTYHIIWSQMLEINLYLISSSWLLLEAYIVLMLTVNTGRSVGGENKYHAIILIVAFYINKFLFFLFSFWQFCVFFFNLQP